MAAGAIPLVDQTLTTDFTAKNVQSTASAASTDTTADIIVDKLIAWNVQQVFGLTGDGVNPLVEALRKKKDKIKYITVRHEESAAFMASGYAKYTGKLGVCLATTGPGAVHLMNGLYDAAMEGAAVLAITGIINHDLLGTQFTQEVNTVKMLQDLAVYNQDITGPLNALTVVDLACRAALAEPGVAHITVATDTQMKQLGEDKPSKKHGNLTGSSAFQPRLEVPGGEELDVAAKLLREHSKIVILAGRGCLGAEKEVESLARKLGAPVAKALLGKAVLPDDSPYTTGGTGHLGTLPSKQMMEECDLLLILGSNMPHLEYYPKNAVAIQIDRDPRRIGLRYPITLGLHGDVRSTLQALIPMVQERADQGFLQLAQQRMKDWRGVLAKLENGSATPIKPQYLAATVGRLLNEDAVVAIDTGAHTVFTARHWQVRTGQKLAVCGNLASMAPGLPYALAAQVAFPGRQCVAMVGDGSFTMLMGEMATAVMYGLPVKVVVFKNNSLAMDKFEQEEMGNLDYGIALQPIQFAKIAEACGAAGFYCKDPRRLEATIREAFAHAGPVVVEVDVDPDENPQAPEKIKI
ncbi:MAG: pyruvate oxidase [Bacteroidetes bacterium]|nr:pyruvate oxidase [Bacteroidota bacterium]